ncbi:MAG: hypothetical protein KAI79_12240 [Bacteroidales bacterium]|nr:hypothetical protein [Bacteroidales bacterium]
MITDYAYCLNKDTCLHRQGCKRWIGNYTNDEAKELCNTGRDEYVNDAECINAETPFSLFEILKICGAK